MLIFWNVKKKMIGDCISTKYQIKKILIFDYKLRKKNIDRAKQKSNTVFMSTNTILKKKEF